MKFEDLTAPQQQQARESAEERYLAYVLLRQSGKQHQKLREDLKNDFTTGDDRYPKNRQMTLHLLENYSKTAVHMPIPQEGTSFAQKGGKGKGKGVGMSDKDKAYWKDKECYGCGAKGHPANRCPEKSDDNEEGTDNEDDAKSQTSKSSKSSKSRKAKAGKKLSGPLKKAFAQLETKIKAMQGSDGSDDSESESGEGNSFLQLEF